MSSSVFDRIFDASMTGLVGSIEFFFYSPNRARPLVRTGPLRGQRVAKSFSKSQYPFDWTLNRSRSRSCCFFSLKESKAAEFDSA
ncbi:hypothetical protein PGTUg99_030465 [Puccinia graminis f. sp. tritici]|uniref:Uncharacterized protein n=1 Tax=Puccinia graminis f. sp. tritici TaxID=56615 RepID=A0A5B0NI75_PUCGR|nr:hypothetical protein PGTUg99_030465 [Puccinia graminis f. sp. tritici]